MKIATPPSRGLLSYLPSVFAMSIGIAGFGLHGQAVAEAVDSELVLLVDVSQSGLNKNEFSALMGSYASSFTSSQVLNSIQSGTYGRIAVSLMLYGDSSVQQVGIPWMSIGSAAEAAQFATLANNLVKPNSSGFPSVGSAITAATGSFGTETGGSSNGFESSLQIIDVAAAVVPNTAGGAADLAARNGAMDSGVDLINTIALGNKAAAIETYYSNNVIGSGLPGVVATATSSPLDGTLAITIGNSVTASVGNSLTAVPEPSSFVGALFGTGFLLFRRRRA
jgi:Protein of unknown function (DUF1194)